MGSPSLESPPIMNPSYRQTFSRHKVLFSLPIVITTVLAIWFVAGTPKQYKAGATLFVDTKSGQSSLDDPNPGNTWPSARAQQLLTELLATKRFQGEIGRGGPLNDYLASHPSEGWGPTSLLKKLRGTGSVEDRTATALDAKHVLTALSGPQFLGIEFHGPTPEVAVGTVRAMITAFNQQRRELDVSRQEGAMARLSNQIDAAKARIARLNTEIASGTHSTGELQVLNQALRTAQVQLRGNTRSYNQATLALDAAKVESGIYQVYDAPNLPAPAVSGLKKSVMMVFAGMFVGFLISLLAVVLLTSSDSKAGQDELRDVVEAHNEPVPLDRDAVKTSNGSNGSNGAGAEQTEPKKAERAG